MVTCCFFQSWSGTSHAGESVSLYDFGADEIAYLALPQSNPKGSILLIPNSLAQAEVAASRCDLLARLGFIAMTLDFYNSQTVGTLEEARKVQSKLSSEDTLNTIRAALNLLSQSPKYKTNRIMLGVWGQNMDYLKLLNKELSSSGILSSVVWFEPDVVQQIETDLSLPVPLLVITTDEFWKKKMIDLMQSNPSPNEAVSVISFKAPVGYTLSGRTDSAGAETWAYVIELWSKETRNHTQDFPQVITPLTADPATQSQTIQPIQPTQPTKPQSKIMPKRSTH